MSLAVLSLIGLICSVIISFFGLHQVPEGYVAVYFRFGKLLHTMNTPGYNLKFPFVTKHENVQITVQTDEVKDIPCGTSGGVMIYFDKIEVVNKLRKEYVLDTISNYTELYDKIWIYDKIHHEINQFCSKNTLQDVFIDKFDSLDEELIKILQNDLPFWAPGIEIISIRVTKPKIPKVLEEAYRQIENQRASLSISAQNQKVKLKETETQQKQALMKVQTELQITKIQLEKTLELKKGELKSERIENQMYLEKEQAFTDAFFYSKEKELEVQKAKLTSEYLTLKGENALIENTEFYLGESIPVYMNPGAFSKGKKQKKEKYLVDE